MTLLSRCFYKTLTRCVFRTQWNMLDGAFCKNFQRLKAVNYFRKKLHPNEYTTSDRRKFDTDITLTRWKENIGEFPRHLDVPFRFIFDWRKNCCRFDLLSSA